MNESRERLGIVTDSIVRELWGPVPRWQGKGIALKHVEGKLQRQKIPYPHTGFVHGSDFEEVLTSDEAPLYRYAIGVLRPIDGQAADLLLEEAGEQLPDAYSTDRDPMAKSVVADSAQRSAEFGAFESGIPAHVNQSSLALSVLVEKQVLKRLRVSLKGSWYQPIDAPEEDRLAPAQEVAAIKANRDATLVSIAQVLDLSVGYLRKILRNHLSDSPTLVDLLSGVADCAESRELSEEQVNAICVAVHYRRVVSDILSGAINSIGDACEVLGGNESEWRSLIKTYQLDVDWKEQLAGPRIVATLEMLSVQDHRTSGKNRAKNNWWWRKPTTWSHHFVHAQVATDGTYMQRVTPPGAPEVEIGIRTQQRGGYALVTAWAVNREKSDNKNPHGQSIFQSRLVVESGARTAIFADLRLLDVRPNTGGKGTRELAYRDYPNFGVGHGCSATWQVLEPTAQDRRAMVSGETLPIYDRDMPQGRDLKSSKSAPIILSMAGVSSADLEQLAAQYDAWIQSQKKLAAALEGEYAAAANLNITSAESSLTRIRDGIRLIRSDAKVSKAFQLMCRAMHMQRARSSVRKRRAPVSPSRDNAYCGQWDQPIKSDSQVQTAWRPFQLAFILQNLKGSISHEEREIVDVLWFPTGGGKTEAYLGLIGFLAIYRRLMSPDDDGTVAIMRYTLRLLTAQQFSRAAALFCALEIIREQHHKELGSTPFTVGVWIGQSQTPNSNRMAAQLLDEMSRNRSQRDFLLSMCPWCGASMGKQLPQDLSENHVPRWDRVPVLGHTKSRGKRGQSSVLLHCPDMKCEFSAKLPVTVIDEEIYLNPPSLLIGTVDKFAQLAHVPAARAIFGIGEDGNRAKQPPTLLVQDELHLITGPLGTVDAEFETVVMDLCTSEDGSRPKVIGASATIAGLSEHILGLYGMDDARVFPAPGISADDNFFSVTHRASGERRYGSRHLGIFAPDIGSHSHVLARVLAAAHMAPIGLVDSDRDPYWTNVAFFNSLKDLGFGLTIAQSDLPDYLSLSAVRALRNQGLSEMSIRYVNEDAQQEITSRLSSAQLGAAFQRLENSFETDEVGSALDIAFCSSIIEVGVDVERLGLMTVSGFPKSMAQYIQVTGRVGRNSNVNPGLVLVALNARRPRDRSVYEQFQSIHQRLYENVESASVTPYSSAAVERTLPTAVVASVRQRSSSIAAPSDVTDATWAHAFNLHLNRVRSDEVAHAMLQNQILLMRQNLKDWSPAKWFTPRGEQTEELEPNQMPLLALLGSNEARMRAGRVWLALNSMRSVDLEACLVVTRRYNLLDTGKLFDG